MPDLLDQVLDVHGGLDNWRRVAAIDMRVTLRGNLLSVKQHPNGIRDALVKIDAHHSRTVISPFPTRGSRSVFENGQVLIQNDQGSVTSAMEHPRETFAGHQRQTPWSELQFLYFVGYAFQNYFTMPFLLAESGVVCREVDPHEEHGEVWRVLRATFPPK